MKMISIDSPVYRISTTIVLSLFFSTICYAEKLAIIGDSLSTDLYGVLFGTDNWVDILENHRSIEFTSISNVAIPGDKIDDVEGKLTDNGIGDILFRSSLNNALNNADYTIIFLGGNDINSSYQTIYEGGSPTSLVNHMLTDMQGIIDYVQNENPDTKILIINTPHVGATPDVQGDHPTDPVKTGRITAALDSYNAQLESLATAEGAAVADIYSLTLELLEDDTYCIDGFTFLNEADSQARNEYLFTDDGFHPSRTTHSRFAQIILTELNSTWNAGFTEMPNRELLQDVLGYDPDLPYESWIAAYSVTATGQNEDPDGDGASNLLEFALGMDPRIEDAGKLPTVSFQNNSLTMTFTPRIDDCQYASMIAQWSPDLMQWYSVPETDINRQPGQIQASIPASARGFLRLAVQSSQ